MKTRKAFKRITRIICMLIVSLFFQIHHNMSAQESFYQILPKHAGNTVDLNLHGIPFKVIQTDRGYANLASSAESMVVANQPLPVQAIFFLGMVTEKPEASAWWGPTERWYAYNNRIFIGDQPGKIFIVYQDTTADVVPVIFGVNLWNYELLNEVKDSEGYLTTYWGPYPEPFQSDRRARALLDSSLVLMGNDTVKGAKYIMGIKARNKPVSRIILSNDNVRTAGFYITAITCMTTPSDLNPAWRLTDERFYAQKKYYENMDKLARRLYQFRDELPLSDPLRLPENYNGPVVTFTGSPLAEVFTNVYIHNLHDMRTKKVDSHGGMHTSSGDLADFGIYIGMGTFKTNAKCYYDHVWTRDLGRCLMEIVESGETERTVKAGNEALRLLYDPSSRFNQPNWKRIANASELNNEELWRSVGGKENDGHGAMMLFIYRLIQHRCVDGEWIRTNWKALCDAAEWFCWQMDNPEKSGFNRVLSSESEASTQQYGSFDLFSNYNAYMGLKSFAILAAWNDDEQHRARWDKYADSLHNGIMEMFTTMHPRFGRIFVDITNDCWTWEYKRFAPLFLASDLNTYDLVAKDPELYSICYNTYLAQKEDYFSYASGRQMGYGQGYITEAAIMLDEPDDMRGYVEQAAAFCYHHADYNYIVPEGVVVHPSERFWFRNSDLGNCVQQAEIIKAGRLLIGLDDLDPEKGLSVIPRLPSTWKTIEVQDYPVVATDLNGQSIRSLIKYQLRRIEQGYSFSLEASVPVRMNQLRLGPFKSKNIKITPGKIPFAEKEIRGRYYIYVDLSGCKGPISLNANEPDKISKHEK
jgi:hypothetical protein